MQKNPKKRSKRSTTKYPALTRKMNLKGRRYYIEPDYINGVGDIRALTPEEKEFLNKFYEEYINTSFSANPLHKEKDKQRELFRENNHRNVCLYNLKQKTGQLTSFNVDYYDKISAENYGYLDFEDSLTNEIENKEIAQIIVNFVEKLKKTNVELVEIIKTRFSSYFYRTFSEKELKNMKVNEIGETLYIESKMLLETF